MPTFSLSELPVTVSLPASSIAAVAMPEALIASTRSPTVEVLSSVRVKVFSPSVSVTATLAPAMPSDPAAVSL